MRTMTLCAVVLATALSTVGCDAANDRDNTEFRGWGDHAEDSPEFWEFGWWRAANGDTQVAAGDSVSPFDLIWDLDDGTTSQSVFDPDVGTTQFELIRLTVEDEIRSSSGEVLCTVVQSQTGSRTAYQLLDANGDAVLTLWRRYVFAGDVHVPNKGYKLAKLVRDDTLYSFRNNEIYVDRWWAGEVAATADVKVARANPMRKLELASLLAGECGSLID